MKTFFLIWQDAETHRWMPVGRLDRVKNKFVFGYVKGSQISKNFVPFGVLRNLDSVYVSDELFPVFANRVLNQNRPEFEKYAKWSAMDSKTIDPLSLAAQMGGTKATDNLQIYPVPDIDQTDQYSTDFFSHGVSHLPEASRRHFGDIEEGSRVFAMLDLQNPHDANAIAIRAEVPMLFLGYLPRYLSLDVAQLIYAPKSEVVMRLKKFNQEAPAKFQLLFNVTTPWPNGFTPCRGKEFQTIVEYEPAKIASDAHSVN